MIYKLRVILDTQEDVFRDVEIKASQTLWNLHEGLKSAFSLKGEELASFYMSDSDWSQGEETPLEDMSEDDEALTMSDIYIKESFEKAGDRMLYVYDFMNMWSFYIELVEIMDKKPIGNYPLTTYRFGKMPLKAPEKSFSSMPINGMDEDEDDIFMDDELGDGLGDVFDEDEL